MNEFRGEARKTFHAPEEIHALDHMLHDMRVYKSREELSAMRRSAKVAIEAGPPDFVSCPLLVDGEIEHLQGLSHLIDEIGLLPIAKTDAK